MKQTLKQISDLSNIKVGDKLFSTMFGEVIVSHIDDEDTDYPIDVCILNYDIHWRFTKDGRYYNNGDYDLQVLFLSNPFDLITDNKSGEKWMMVSHDKRVWVKRRVIKKVGGKYVVWNSGDTDEQADKEIYTTTFPYAKEIKQRVTLTKQEIIEKFGLDDVEIEVIE